jgi:hypothetical protein
MCVEGFYPISKTSEKDYLYRSYNNTESMDEQTKKELKTQEDAIFLNNTYYTIIIKIIEVEETSPFLNKIGGGLKCSVADLFGGNFELERTRPENKCTMRRRRILEPYNRQTVPYKNKKKYRQFLQVFFYKKGAGEKPVKCFMLEDEIDTAREIYLIDEGSKTPGQRAVIHLVQKDSKVVTDKVAAYLAKLMRNSENKPNMLANIPDSVVSLENVTILEPDEPEKKSKPAHTDVNAENIKGKIRDGVAQILGGGDDDDSKRANAQNIDAEVAEGGVAIIRNNIALKNQAKARDAQRIKEKIEGITASMIKFRITNGFLKNTHPYLTHPPCENQKVGKMQQTWTKNPSVGLPLLSCGLHKKDS